MNRALRVLMVCGGFLLSTVSAIADEPDEAGTVKAALAKIFPNTTPDLVSPAPTPGFYEVLIGTDIYYVSKDGRYLLQGDLFDLQTRENITEAKRNIGRQKVIKGIDESSMIVFAPKVVKHTVTVFTDLDCGYCRKLHKEINTYLDRGIRIRYLAYPRSGPNTPSYYKAISVWCAADPKAAMTTAKSGGNVPEKKCKNPVDEHMAAAALVGVSGTPTMVFENGAVIPGYLPADKLLIELDKQVTK